MVAVPLDRGFPLAVAGLQAGPGLVPGGTCDFHVSPTPGRNCE